MRLLATKMPQMCSSSSVPIWSWS